MTRKIFDDMTFDEFCEVAAKEGITNRVKLKKLFLGRPKGVASSPYCEAMLRKTFREFKERLA